MCTPPGWIVYRPTLLYKLEIYINCFPTLLPICLQTATYDKFIHSRPLTEFGLVYLDYMNPFTGSPIFLISSIESQCSSWTVFYIPVSWKNLVKLIVLPSLVKLPFTLGGSMILCQKVQLAWVLILLHTPHHVIFGQLLTSSVDQFLRFRRENNTTI